MLSFHYKHTSIPQGNITFLFFQICLMLFFITNTQGYPREALQVFGYICFMIIFHYKQKRIPQRNITIIWVIWCILIFHYKHTRIPLGNITILWLNMFYAYFSLQTHKYTPGKHYNSLVKYVLRLFFITNTQGYPMETLQFFG